MKHRFGIGLIIMGVIALFCIASTDDVQTMQGVSAPIAHLIFKTLLAFGVLGGGVVLSRR